MPSFIAINLKTKFSRCHISSGFRVKSGEQRATIQIHSLKFDKFLHNLKGKLS